MDFKRIKTLTLEEQVEILFYFLYNSSDEEIASSKDIMKKDFFDILTGMNKANKEIGNHHVDFAKLSVKYALDCKSERRDDRLDKILKQDQ